MVELQTSREALTTRRFVAFYVAVALTAGLFGLSIWNAEYGDLPPVWAAALVLGATVFGVSAYTSFGTDELYDIWRVGGGATILLFFTMMITGAAAGGPSTEAIRSSPTFAAVLALTSTALTVTVATTIPLAIGMFDRWRADPPEELQP